MITLTKHTLWTVDYKNVSWEIIEIIEIFETMISLTER